MKLSLACQGNLVARIVFIRKWSIAFYYQDKLSKTKCYNPTVSEKKVFIVL